MWLTALGRDRHLLCKIYVFDAESSVRIRQVVTIFAVILQR
jgi:hypothetical protein